MAPRNYLSNFRRSSLYFLFAALLLTACGGTDSSTSGGGSIPNPPPHTKGWTWIGGSNSIGVNGGHGGVYGIQGVAAITNAPGGRQGATSWTDAAGNFWLFGGYGKSAKGPGSGTAGIGYLNDLWEFNPAKRTWTWIGGSNTTSGNFGSSGVYGTLGIATSTNMPGGRGGATGWTDSHGTLWLFGGYGFDSTGTQGALNDLWSFDPSTKQWTWVSGSNKVTASNGNAGQPGIYGSRGIASVGNTPGGRAGSVGWVGNDGSLWLFGGRGFASTGSGAGDLNDLWMFNPASKLWTWVSGSNTLGGYASQGQPGIYGTQGTASTANTPGGTGERYRVDRSKWPALALWRRRHRLLRTFARPSERSMGV